MSEVHTAAFLVYFAWKGPGGKSLLFSRHAFITQTQTQRCCSELLSSELCFRGALFTHVFGCWFVWTSSTSGYRNDLFIHWSQINLILSVGDGFPFRKVRIAMEWIFLTNTHIVWYWCWNLSVLNVCTWGVWAPKRIWCGINVSGMCAQAHVVWGPNRIWCGINGQFVKYRLGTADPYGP